MQGTVLLPACRAAGTPLPTPTCVYDIGAARQGEVCAVQLAIGSSGDAHSLSAVGERICSFQRLSASITACSATA